MDLAFTDLADIISFCHCPEEYSIEVHGDGYALYLGRCNHRHGYNLCNFKEPDKKKLEEMLKTLNGKTTEVVWV